MPHTVDPLTVWERVDAVTFRLRTPKGWIVRVSHPKGYSTAESMIHFDEKDGLWDPQPVE